MSEHEAGRAALERIEKALQAVRADVADLRERVDALRGGAKPMTTRETIELLDQFRAGEALGEALFGAWIATCTTDCLRGALRTIQMREGSHARLLEERVKELGGTPSCELPEELPRQALELYGSRETGDLEKLQKLVAALDPDTTLKGLDEGVLRLDRDQETQSLLRTILQDERATLTFLHEACAQLSEAGA